MKKPVRLELNNSGAWKLLGRFDADDDEQASLVMDAAEDLVKTLHNSESPEGRAKLRIVTDDPLPAVLVGWEIEKGWRDVATGEPL